MQNPTVDYTLVTRDNSGAGKGLGCCNNIRNCIFSSLLPLIKETICVINHCGLAEHRSTKVCGHSQ